MAAPSHRTSRFVVALVVALAGLAIAASPARASHASPPPRLSALHMQWFRWHPPTRVASTTASVGFGSTAVLGLRSMRDLASLRATYGFAHVREIPSLRAAEVSVDEGQLRALLTQGPSDPRVRYVSPLGPERQATSMPNDPLLHALDAQTNLPTEWQFAASHVDRALDFTSGSPSIIVGTIDTGAAAVPDLTGKLDSLWSVTGTQISQSPPEGNDDYGHGTAVASLIAANVDDGFGMAGFGGTTHVIAVHAGNEGFFLDAPVAIALTKLVSLGARIVNMSIGGRTPSAPILVDAIHQAEANGVLLIAAAGNDNGNVGWPAADLQTSDGGRSYGLAVGATNVNGSRAAFSDWGRHLSLVAPGDYGGLCSGVLVALPAASLFDDSCFVTWTGDGGARYGNLEGTSFAAPEVAGIAALIWAARPELKNYQVADIIKQSARRSAPDWTPELGCGILDAGAALELATSRPASAWTGEYADGARCSAAGPLPATWPSEINQTITFRPLRNRTLGDPDFAVRATTSSGLPVSFTATGDCRISRATVHITDAGACVVTAAQAGDAHHNFATSVSRSFLIAPPRVLAFAASGRWGTELHLPFKVGIARGSVSVGIDVQRKGASISQLERSLSVVESRKVYTLAWHAPAAKASGPYRFCVALSDPSGVPGRTSCAPIHLR